MGGPYRGRGGGRGGEGGEGGGGDGAGGTERERIRVENMLMEEVWSAEKSSAAVNSASGDTFTVHSPSH